MDKTDVYEIDVKLHLLREMSWVTFQCNEDNSNDFNIESFVFKVNT